MPDAGSGAAQTTGPTLVPALSLEGWPARDRKIPVHLRFDSRGPVCCRNAFSFFPFSQRFLSFKELHAFEYPPLSHQLILKSVSRSIIGKKFCWVYNEYLKRGILYTDIQDRCTDLKMKENLCGLEQWRSGTGVRAV